MIYMLDTNILIYLMKNKPLVVAERVGQLLPQDQMVMSFVTYAELLKGAYGSENPTKALEAVERISQRVPVVYPTGKIAEHYGKWANILKQKGSPIGNNNLWIACHALAINAVLVTHNVKEFKRVEELNLQDWVNN